MSKHTFQDLAKSASTVRMTDSERSTMRNSLNEIMKTTALVGGMSEPRQKERRFSVKGLLWMGKERRFSVRSFLWKWNPVTLIYVHGSKLFDSIGR